MRTARSNIVNYPVPQGVQRFGETGDRPEGAFWASRPVGGARGDFDELHSRGPRERADGGLGGRVGAGRMALTMWWRRVGTSTPDQSRSWWCVGPPTRVSDPEHLDVGQSADLRTLN